MPYPGPPRGEGMNWGNLHEVTAQTEKPAPGWLFQEIVQDARRCPGDIPDVAEYLMRCVACDSRTVSMKACLAIRHLADDVGDFRHYMRRCPEAISILEEIAQPPLLAIAASIEPQDQKVCREAARRALKSCLEDPAVDKAVEKEAVKSRIQGFGNYQPPPEEEPPQDGAHGLVNKVAGFVGDAVADTVDDILEKGAVGAVRDGIADAADLLLDGVGAVWSFLGGRQNAAQDEDRICRPADGYGGPMPGLRGAAPATITALGPRAVPFPASFAAGAGLVPGAPSFAPAPPYRQQPKTAASAFQVALGGGAVGATHAIYGLDDGFTPSCAKAVSSSAPAPVWPAPPAPRRAAAAAPEPEDILSFDDEPSCWSGAAEPADLLSFDDEDGAESVALSAARATAVHLKGRGNELARQKKYLDAIEAYLSALSALEGQPQGELSQLRAVLFANIAFSYLRQGAYRPAIDAATEAIRWDPTNAKAYYRRCLAYKALQLHGEARRDLEAMAGCSHELGEADMRRLRASLGSTVVPALGEGATATLTAPAAPAVCVDLL